MGKKRTNNEAPVVHTSTPTARKYFLLDACAYLRLFEEPTNPESTKKMKLLLDKRGLGRAYLYMPNFCVAEVFNGFARKHFRERAITKKDYDEFCDGFRQQIRYANIIKSYELNYYHIIGIDWIVEEEHSAFLNRKNSEGELEDWHLSTNDMLIISMGIELTRIHGRSDFHIITADRRIKKICNGLRRLSKDDKKERGIPEDVQFPHCVCVQDLDVAGMNRLFQ